MGKVDYLEWLSAKGGGGAVGVPPVILFGQVWCKSFPKRKLVENPAVLTLESTSSCVSRSSIYKVRSHDKPNVPQKTCTMLAVLFR